MTPLRSQVLIDIFAILVVAVFIILAPNLAGDPGVGWHLKTGEWILQNGTIPYTDPFLSTSGEKIWISNQWLADVLLALAYHAAGWQFISGLVLAIGIFSYLILLPRSLTDQSNISGPVWFIGLLLITLLGAMQWFIRPVIFSFLFFVIVFVRVRRDSLSKRDCIMLPLLFIVWADIHSAFPLGLVLIAIRAVAAPDQRKKVLALLLGCSAATLINPYGIGLHRNIFELLGEPYFMSLNTEWLVPDFQSVQFLPFLIAIVLIVAGLAAGMKLSLFEFLSVLAFLALALRGRRYIPFFAVTAALPILLSFQSILNRLLRPIQHMQLSQAFLETARPWRFQSIPSCLACILLVIVCTVMPTYDAGPDKHRPKKAIDAIEAVGSTGAIFHTPDIGGYITLRLWPKQRAWIDDRNELNGKAMYEEYFQLIRLRPDWEKIVSKYNFEFVVLANPSAATTLFRTLPDWKILFEDSETVVFQKR